VNDPLASPGIRWHAVQRRVAKSLTSDLIEEKSRFEAVHARVASAAASSWLARARSAPFSAYQRSN
jgi:hypothetical protein